MKSTLQKKKIKDELHLAKNPQKYVIWEVVLFASKALQSEEKSNFKNG